MKKCHGFTLIELALVMAIILALAGLIFAAAGPSRESARQRLCASNIHQIGLAFALYVQDYDGVDPVLGSPMSHAQLGLPCSGSTCLTALLSLIHSRDVLFCPDYHYLQQESLMATTYELPGILDEEAAPELNLPQVVAKRGGEYVLAGCVQHNARLDFLEEPRWLTKRVIVLRLNQQVKVEDIPVRLDSRWW